ncbi:ABC transporter ATP-binding protein [Egicoccus sp. AB-alg2]|uniref:ABC transporter ATP-binding protein n=1 Tax=Egicoccus sp. AB-alg2 TaxID=3242693 RepID=UPI00359E1C04
MPESSRSVTASMAAECAGVVRIYSIASGEVHALRGVDARFPARTISAVVGPSGSGKSSLLRILAALDRPSAGTVRLGGEPIDQLSGRALRRLRRRKVGFMFQRPSDNLLPGVTALDQVAQAGRLRGLSRRQAAGEADGLLGDLGLGDRRDHRPHELSGGQQQRVALAQAVVGRPSLVIADEPTAELDSGSADLLLGKMRLLADRGVAIVLSTHDPRVVQAAERTLSLHRGAVASETTDAGVLAVIDDSGRVQIPPSELARFPDRRAVVTVDADGIRITPPGRTV